MPANLPTIEPILVSLRIRARFDVVERATGQAKRVTFFATVGVPFDETDHAEDAASFIVRDDRRSARLDYVRTEGGTYALRGGLDRWQKSFKSIRGELELAEDESRIDRYWDTAPGNLHGITGKPIKSWSTIPLGTVGDEALERDFDLSAVPARVDGLRRAYAENLLLTRRGLAYKVGYPSWMVAEDGSHVLLASPSANRDASGTFGLGRLEEACALARRLSGNEEVPVLGHIVSAPDDLPADRSAAAAARSMADTISSSLAPQLHRLGARDVGLWHDCANAEEILSAGERKDLEWLLRACRDLARNHAGGPGMLAGWKWRAVNEDRIAIELGEAGPAPGPRP